MKAVTRYLIAGADVIIAVNVGGEGYPRLT